MDPLGFRLGFYLCQMLGKSSNRYSPPYRGRSRKRNTQTTKKSKLGGGFTNPSAKICASQNGNHFPIFGDEKKILKKPCPRNPSLNGTSPYHPGDILYLPVQNLDPLRRGLEWMLKAASLEYS